jgi:50S ribosomal protein L16 3-hydroxylase
MLPMTPIDMPTPLLGGQSPAQFMRRFWQRQPLLVRGAVPQLRPLLSRTALFALAARDDVESRLIVREGMRWSLRRGPLSRRALPLLSAPQWTLLVQGLDLHVPAAHELLARFRFVPDARLDDVMLSYASQGGGVGPHTDAYDVFLLQTTGRRRWRFAPCPRPVWRDDVPLKMLARLPAQARSCVLGPGDMLYLPPGWAHEGTAVGGDCTTASIGFRAPARDELAGALLDRLADAAIDDRSPRYADRHQGATRRPAAVPQALRDFAMESVRRRASQGHAVDRALGEWLTEPKAQVWFETTPETQLVAGCGVALDRRTRMVYIEREVFINGESLSATGRDAVLVKRLADARRLSPDELRRASPAARALIAQWLLSGWLHVLSDD